MDSLYLLESYDYRSRGYNPSDHYNQTIFGLYVKGNEVVWSSRINVGKFDFTDDRRKKLNSLNGYDRELRKHTFYRVICG